MAIFRLLRLSFDDYKRANGHAQWNIKNSKKKSAGRNTLPVATVTSASPLSEEPSKD